MFGDSKSSFRVHLLAIFFLRISPFPVFTRALPRQSMIVVDRLFIVYPQRVRISTAGNSLSIIRPMPRTSAPTSVCWHMDRYHTKLHRG